MNLKERFAQVPLREPEIACVYFGDETFTWRQLGQAAREVARLLADAGLPEGAAVGWTARNRPEAVAGALGLLMGGYFLSPLNSNDPLGKRVADIGKLRCAAVLDIAGAWLPEIEGAIAEVGALGLEIQLRPEPRAQFRPGLGRLGPGPFRDNPKGAVLERMSSGTTGEPKRIPVPAELMNRAMELAFGADTGRPPGKPLSPQMVVSPFAHASGVWSLASALYSGRPMILHEKFSPDAWIASVRRFRPKVASLVPSMIKMVLECDPPPEDLASLICIRSGTAPLDPETKRIFESKYAMPILIDYGASEFLGGIAGWSLPDYKEFGSTKTGSVGRLRPDIEIRVVDADTGAELGPGPTGVLCLKSPRFGNDWIRTTDLASYDDDRFLYIHGRADEAINRGGFKVLPERVAMVLRQFPGVRDACVLGVKDDRLGETPLAIVEPATGSKLDVDALREFAREHMPAYEAPAHYEVVEALPRTVSLKVSRPAVREQFKDRYRF